MVPFWDLSPPRLLSAREEGCLMQRPHRPGWSSSLVISGTRSKLGPPFFCRRPQYAYSNTCDVFFFQHSLRGGAIE